MKTLSLLIFLPFLLLADGIKDNFPDKVRQIPQIGIELKPDKKAALEKRRDEIGSLVQKLKNSPNPKIKELIPDVEIFYKAIDYGLKYREILFEKDLKYIGRVLDEGVSRGKALLSGQAPWLTKKGLVVRGFISKIDQSVQPYGLVIPESYDFQGKEKHRLDIWLHGRNEKILELAFLNQRMNSLGKFAPENTIVLHPFGRYSNAFKFAGEVDVFEALKHAKRWYRVDKNLIANRGFSMGGAGCWQLAVHYSDQFFASNPGAGFSETPDFLKVFQKQELKPAWFEKKLWQWYDCPDYSVNLKQCPTICYSGENDRQIQAARMMEQGHERAGMKLLHLIGPKMGHSYDKDSAKKVDSWLADKAKAGKVNVPKQIDFVTATLKYNRMNWIRIDGITEHWEKSKVKAAVQEGGIEISTQGITAFHVHFGKGESPYKQGAAVKFNIDDQQIIDHIGTGFHLQLKTHFVKVNGKWELGLPEKGLHKQHDLQGPIDDAFMDSFVFVKPSGKSANPLFQTWCDSEFNRAVKHWRQHFRGDAVIRDDVQVTEEDIANSNLILWGDADSNAVINQIIHRLPIKWDEAKIKGNDTFDSKNHALIMIYPNPLNPRKYIVLNSGFTYREFAYLNNARQVPMLPDWAVIDMRTKPGAVWPGKVAKAGFFDESWQLKSK